MIFMGQTMKYEQMSLFDYTDERQGFHHCNQCKNAKFKERTRSGINVYYCNVVRSYITDHSIDITFHKNCFERRGKDD